MVYEPNEDSYLLQRNIAKYAKGTVLDMGTGSGIIALEATKSLKVKKVYAADIDKEAVFQLKQKIKNTLDCRIENCNTNLIEVIHSNLFKYFKKKNDWKKKKNTNQTGKTKTKNKAPLLKFDLITFNPPYLPDDQKVKDIALDGGKHGYELIGRFIDNLPPFLNDNGVCLLLFSSFSKKEMILEIISKQALDAKMIDSMKLDFEELYIYEIRKSAIRLELEKNGITNIIYLAKGKRGVVFRASLGKKTVAVKTKNPSSEAIGRIKHEGDMLKLVNSLGIGPKFVMASDNFVAYEYFDGIRFEEFIKKNKKAKIANVIKEIFRQLYVLDTLKLNKAEMSRPIKHILVGKAIIQKAKPEKLSQSKKIVLIDFERAHHTEKPQNITQFCNYLISERLYLMLKEKGFNYDKGTIIGYSKRYAESYREEINKNESDKNNPNASKGDNKDYLKKIIEIILNLKPKSK
jgi:predicted Ser/Thr protein kinase/methylase of polypeptide subunit release factors